MSQLLAKRGIAYQCILCQYKGEKRYVEGHAMKTHMSVEQAPFYCQLCVFKARTEKYLRKHTKGYKAHLEAWAKEVLSAPSAKEDSYLIRNAEPLQLQNFLRRLFVKESNDLWRQRTTTCLDVTPNQVADKSPKEDNPTVVPAAASTVTQCEEKTIIHVSTGMDVDLPQVASEDEFDILKEILQDEQDFTVFDDPKPATWDILGRINSQMEQQTGLLQSMNTAIRLNTMAISDLAAKMRERERNARRWSCPYNQRFRSVRDRKWRKRSRESVKGEESVASKRVKSVVV